MKKSLTGAILVSLLSAGMISCLFAQSGRNTPLIIDHTATAKFEEIADSSLEKAIELRLMFRHASVGGTIDDGLDCVQGSRPSPVECTFFPPYKYDRRNWEFQGRSNNGWYGKIRDFVKEVHMQADSFDAMAFKYCYLDGLDQLAVPCGSPFNPGKTMQAWDSLRINIETLEDAYPDKIFIWWTIPLTQVGQFCTDTLNSLIRQYAFENNKVLFDIADIEAWDTSQQHGTNASGWEIAFKGYCGEQKPGAQACHPNWLGKLILAKAFWWMMVNLENEQKPESLESNSESYSITLFPNPSKDHITISLSGNQKSAIHISLFDLTGRKIDRNATNCIWDTGGYQILVPVGDLASGYYTFSIIYGQKHVRKKVLIRNGL
ncbi:MAG: T9SS type A sorting domain-containing protein [Bacteroidetes bacterium]|nr:T9SS type A sorting domain-containing protein [Bacteroidota bacterium]MBL6962902.1 T9SS type A sorting domain-containing protein [Bacteroidota bacterium]